MTRLSGVSETDMASAKKFVDLLPAPTEDIFSCHDYRVIGVEAVLEKPNEKAVELEVTLTQAEQTTLKT